MTSSADSRGPTRAARSSSRAQRREDRDVAAGDGDDVIRPGLLQLPLDLVVRGPARSPMRIAVTTAAERALQRRDARRDRFADTPRGSTPALRRAGCLAPHLDQPIALHRSDKRRAAPGDTGARESATPGSRYLAGFRSVAGNRTRRPARHCRNLIASELAADADERAAGRGDNDADRVERESTSTLSVTPAAPSPRRREGARDNAPNNWCCSAAGVLDRKRAAAELRAKQRRRERQETRRRRRSRPTRQAVATVSRRDRKAQRALRAR